MNNSKSRFNLYTIKIMSNLMFCNLFWAFFFSQGLNVLVPYLGENRGFSTSTLGYFMTIGMLVGVAFTFFGGSFVEKFGCKTSMVIFAIIGGASFIGTCLTTSEMLCGSLLALDVACTMMYCQLPMPQVILNWFPRNRGKMLGIATCSVAFSAMLLVPLFRTMIGAMGFKTAGIIAGSWLVLYGILSTFWLNEKPQDVGLEPDGIAYTPEEIAQQQKEAEEEKKNRSPWTIKSVLLNRPLMFVAIGWGLQQYAQTGFTMLGSSLMVNKGAPLDTALTAVTLGGVACLFGSVISGYVDDLVNILTASKIFVGLQLVGCLICFLAPTNIPMVVVGGYLLIMFTAASGNNLTPSHCAQKCKPADYTFVYKVVVSVYGLIRAFATTGMSLSLDLTGSYTAGMGVAAAALAVGLVLINMAGTKVEMPPEKVKQAA